MRRGALWLACSLSLASCFGAAPPDGKYYCQNNTHCLSGYVCYQSYCCKQDPATGLCADHPCLAEGKDSDKDGFPVCAGDCDDNEASVHPGAAEACDGKDNDCDGQLDEGVGLVRYRDRDGDGHGSSQPADAVVVCQDLAGLSQTNDDCDDSDARRFGGNPEVCDGVDNDCNLEVDDGVSSTWYLDQDGDGYGRTDSPLRACAKPAGHAALAGDCDDASEFIHPNAKESCNGVDDDCDGLIDEGVKLDVYPDADGDGFGQKGANPVRKCTADVGEALNALDCNDSVRSINPAAGEACNGVDDDCDGLTDEGVTTTYYADVDRDGYGARTGGIQACTAPSGRVANNSDCDDALASVNPAALEVCNSRDDDCDGLVDEGLRSTYFRDSDGDGYGDPFSPLVACPPVPSTHEENPLDCDDARSDVWPGAPELCDARDNDCDGVKDNSPTCGPRIDQAEVAALWGAGFANGSAGNSMPTGCLGLSAGATALTPVEDTAFKAAGAASIKVADTSTRDFFAYFPRQRNGGWSLNGQTLRFQLAGSAASWDTAFRQPLVMFCSSAGTFARYQPSATSVTTAFSSFSITIPPNTTTTGPWSYGGSFSWGQVSWIEIHLNNGASSGTASLWVDDFRLVPQ